MTKYSPGTLMNDMRAQAPLVQCITNFVAMNVAANVMLAAGASPAMVHAAEEAGEFARFSGAVTINIGTISPDWAKGMMVAAEAATDVGAPWVFDPVAHFATAYRREVTAALMALKPSIIRGNASEILALAGSQSAAKGVDSRDSVQAAETAARSLAASSGAVVAVTGEVDFITDGVDSLRVSGGSALMPKVTALGCSLTCLVGAYAAIRPNEPLLATAAALAHYAAAGEDAGRLAAGPGSFASLFLDRLALIDAETLDARGGISAA